MFNNIDKRIIDFIKKHHILTLATAKNNLPYCCTVFYTYLEDINQFIFTSSEETKHTQDFLLNYKVSGTIALETKLIGIIKGIQFCGDIMLLNDEQHKIAKNAYLKAFPIATFMDIHLWAIKPNFIKMTDNKLGFGKKLIWQQE